MHIFPEKKQSKIRETESQFFFFLSLLSFTLRYNPSILHTAYTNTANIGHVVQPRKQ